MAQGKPFGVPIFAPQAYGCGSKPMVPFGFGAPPILVYFSGWIGMFTWGYGILTHGHVVRPVPRFRPSANDEGLGAALQRAAAAVLGHGRLGGGDAAGASVAVAGFWAWCEISKLGVYPF